MRSFMPPLTTSLRWMTPSSAAAVGDGERRAAGPRDAIGRFGESRRHGAAALPHEGGDRLGRALAQLAAVEIDAAHARVGRERDEVRARAAATSRPRSLNCSLASTTIERPSGVSSARLESCAASASSALGHAADRQELDRLAVAERDGAGLVEQQRVDVAGGLDRLAAHREHVVLHHAVHAGDADGRQQAADRRRDQADEQRRPAPRRSARCRCRARRRRRPRTAAASRPPAGR